MGDSKMLDLLEKCETYTTNVHDAEKYLQHLSMFVNEKRIDVVKTVISVMQRYKNEHKIQSEGVFCLTSFSIHNDMEDIDRGILNEMMDIFAFAIESYPDDECIVRDALLSFYENRFLKDIDFVRCLKVSIDYFVKSCNPELEKLALSVYYDLSYGIVPNESLVLNFPPQYQAKLLSMIRPLAKSKPIDKSTSTELVSLINLISENLSACKIFIKEEDVEMFIEMLDTFDDESEVVGPLLVIFYSILETGLFIQQFIQRPHFISKVSEFLGSEDFSLSNDAAGVMAYLLADMQICQARQILADQLHRVIKNWQVPKFDGTLVYDGFEGMYSLIQYTNIDSVQLYAVWCIHNFCDFNPDVSCKMLERENGLEILKKLKEDESTHVDVRDLCHKIFDIYTANRTT